MRTLNTAAWPTGSPASERSSPLSSRFGLQEASSANRTRRSGTGRTRSGYGPLSGPLAPDLDGWNGRTADLSQTSLKNLVHFRSALELPRFVLMFNKG